MPGNGESMRLPLHLHHELHALTGLGLDNDLTWCGALLALTCPAPSLCRNDTSWGPTWSMPDVGSFVLSVTFDEAGEILGVTRLTVQSWARSGRLQPVTGPEIDGSHAYRFEKATLVQWRHERLIFGEAMALLGVSKATLDRWANQGKLAPLEDMEGKQRWFARADVEGLRN